MTNFKPGKGKILVKPKKVENKTASGIRLPDAEGQRSTQGEVVAVGKETEEYKVGDMVLFGVSSGVEIKLESDVYLLMFEREIYGTL